MNKKAEFLSIFERNQGQTLSGEFLAKKIGVSRNAVWKAVNDLRKDGYIIDAATKSGYRYSSENFVLSAYSIEKNLEFPLKITVLESVSSTNDYLKEKATFGADEGEVVIAKSQSAGKGRMGRNFESKENGLYMSLLLKPDLPAEKAVFITTCAAVAVAQAIESLTNRKAGIKWVNDIFLDNKKVCGILTEASLDVETAKLQYAVLGIGVNISEPKGGFSPEIKDIAGSVYGETAPKNAVSVMAGEILNKFFALYSSLLNPEINKEYKRRSFLLGEEVFFTRGEQKQTVTVKDITENYGLLVEYPDGREEVLQSGEVSIKRYEK